MDYYPYSLGGTVTITKGTVVVMPSQTQGYVMHAGHAVHPHDVKENPPPLYEAAPIAVATGFTVLVWCKGHQVVHRVRQQFTDR